MLSAVFSTVSAPAALIAASSTSSALTFIAGVLSGLAGGVVLYLLVYRYSARRLPEIRAEEASELVRKLGGQLAAFICALPAGLMVGFVNPAATHLSAGPLRLVIHLMGVLMIGVPLIGIAWLAPRLRAAQSASTV
ncbi:PTS sugar transporter [Actinomyces viscosus]|uniref:PTS sugar transporter n=1 Tax=Actinomyces viscosus TaxID=1656 RepID=UPI0028E45FCA|nr:PTS sugar transporter [Actinomyces viscosus]